MISCKTVLVGVMGLVLGSTPLSASAEDWPQHLGPTQDAVSTETNLLDAWPDGGPPERWRHDVGIGFAGTAIVDGKVFLNDREQGKADTLRVFDLDTGEELWQYTQDAPGRVNYPGSRATPCVTDTHVYTTGSLGHINAINRETRKPDWAFNIYDRYPDQNRAFGYAPSIVIVDGHLLLSPTAQDDPVVVALDPKTGETKWESEATLETFHTHHSPVLRTVLGQRVIACRDRTHVYLIDIATGKTLLAQQTFERQGGSHVTIPPITVFGENNAYMFVTNGYENGSVLYEVAQQPGQDGLQAREVYRIFEGSQVHPAIYHDKHLYFNINENANLRGRNLKGGLACLDASTGQIKWKTENEPNLNRGAITFADGKLYVFDGDSGELLLVNPKPEKFDLISKTLAIEPKGRSNNAWSPIVISDGRLVVRDHQQIVCFDLREIKASQ